MPNVLYVRLKDADTRRKVATLAKSAGVSSTRYMEVLIQLHFAACDKDPNLPKKLLELATPATDLKHE